MTHYQRDIRRNHYCFAAIMMTIIMVVINMASSTKGLDDWGEMIGWMNISIDGMVFAHFWKICLIRRFFFFHFILILFTEV